MIRLVYKRDNKFYNHVTFSSRDITLKHLEKLPPSNERRLLIDFFKINGVAYSGDVKKQFMQCLRRFDEVGICFDVWEALDSLYYCDYFFIAEGHINEPISQPTVVVYNLGEI